ncbi:hypothetical protein FACS1894130_02960 [Spirochaetia bacterium]|nr:hypothetical protein FACS1894130_02960 [Spirochaetia bacterium]
MPGSIIRDNAIALIMETLSAFDRHLSELDDMKKSRIGYLMNQQAKEVAEEYTPFHGAVSNVAQVDDSLKNLDNKELADMLYKCVLLANLYNLKVGSLPDIPEGEVDEIPFVVDGEYLTESEKALFIEILGSNYAGVLNNIVFYSRLVTEAEIRSSTNGMAVSLPPTMPPHTGVNGISLPNGKIFIPSTARTGDNEKLALLMHEIFHQVEYARDGATPAFGRLLAESNAPIYPYDFMDTRNQNDLNGDGQLSSLDEIKTLEGQAELVYHFSLGYLNGKFTQNYSSLTIDTAQILYKSGYRSDALKDVLKY